jgi:hypothetical protein
MAIKIDLLIRKADNIREGSGEQFPKVVNFKMERYY